MVTLALGVSAQSTRNKELHLYGSIGAKVLQQKYFTYETNISPSLASAIGGGAIWQRGKTQLGGEFFYTNATSHKSGYRSAYSGVNAALLAGYRFDLNQTLKASVQTGIGYSLNHMYITDETFVSHDHLNTAIFHNNNYSIPVAVMLQRINPRGTFMGLKVGYTVNLTSNHWRSVEGTTTHHFSTGTDGFFAQLIFGGLLHLE